MPGRFNPSDVPSTADPKQASAGDQSAPPTSPPRLLDALRRAIRVRHYSIRTEEAYVDGARRFIRFHGRRHPRELGGPEVVAAKTQRRLPVVLTPSEVRALWGELSGTMALVAALPAPQAATR